MKKPLRITVAALALTIGASFALAEAPLRDVIDQQIAAKQQAEGVKPAPLATDAIFLRRVHLDLLGTIPSHDESKTFIDDKSPDKREKLIDKLLADPRYAQHQCDVWDMLWFGRHPPGYDADKRPGFQKWLRERFAENTPYDKIVLAMLKAEGNTADDGAPYYLLQYRGHPDDAVQAIVQRFLGVQLQCARCHDHPYEPWKQIEFYGMAAFLARIDTVEVGKNGEEKKIMIGEKPIGEIDFTGPANKQEAGKKGEPVKPRFLAGDVLDEPTPPADVKEVKFQSGKAPPKPEFSRKDKLAEWVTSSTNPYFARATANRIWAQFMGRGIVHPVDDMSKDNKPTHPELLDALSKELVAHRFDLKWFIREIVSSKAYQVGSVGDAEEAAPLWYERARVRPLSAEELVDAWRVATYLLAADPKAEERIAKDRTHPLGGYLTSFFGEPANGEGNFQGGLHEHLYLNNGGVEAVIRTDKGSLYDAIAKGEGDWTQRVNRLFLSTLSRYPDDEERARFVAYLSAEERSENRVREAIWALITCSEFRFNH